MQPVYVIVHDYGLNGAGVEPVGYLSAAAAELDRPELERKNGQYTGYSGATVVELVAVKGDLEPAIDVAHLDRQREWSARTFGPGARTAGVIDHITKELAEVAAAPDDVVEWADLIILAFDGALRAGHEPADIIAAIKAKQSVNEGRVWPDWRTADPAKAIEHVR